MDDAQTYERGGIHWDTAPRKYYALSGFYVDDSRSPEDQIPYLLEYSAHDDTEALSLARDWIFVNGHRRIASERVVERFPGSHKTRELELPW